MKIKELPPSTNLGGIKVKTPDGQVGYWKSQWYKGVWLTNVHPDTPGDQRVFPICRTIEDVLEWEVTDEEPNLK